MASPRNRHCANYIGTLSFPINIDHDPNANRGGGPVFFDNIFWWWRVTGGKCLFTQVL